MARNPRFFIVLLLLKLSLRALGYSLAPLVLGVILGPIAETNLRRALMTDGDPTLFLTRPISLLFLVAAVLSIGWAIRAHLKKNSNSGRSEDAPAS